VTPNVLRPTVNGLSLRVFDWAPDAWEGTLLLLHGFMDGGSTWDRVAPDLAAARLRVLAPDLRGYGDSGRIGAGGYYHFPDYVMDVADLVAAVVGTSPLYLVGHSMGGTIATLFAGTFPERIAKLALLEGIGPPDMPFELGPVRFRRWVDEVQALRARGPERSFDTHDDALRRLAANHPGVDPEVLAGRLPHLVRDLPDGGLTWAHDALHKTTSPMPFFAPLFVEFAKKIAAPTLFVDGGPKGYHPPDEGARLAAFKNLARTTIPDAGHMIHWTRPRELAKVLVAFWKTGAP
jgi:pimeloyl-ACP methyl ester carboxylesterase